MNQTGTAAAGSARIDPARIAAAAAAVAAELRSLRQGSHWRGELASSALSTATAVSALSVLHAGPRRAGSDEGEVPDWGADNELIERGCEYLAATQNADGGWGDTDRSNSNIATAILAVAALRLARAEEWYADAARRGWGYVQRQGLWEGLRQRYGRDKTFAVPILTNAALAGLADWKQVAPLPFELAALPQRWYRFARMPVVSYAIPALVAIGQVREHFAPTRNPLLRPVRRIATDPSLQVLRRMQPASGGYLEAIPLTAFVLMSLSAVGRGEQPVAEDAARFLRSSVRPEGSWPIDTDLAAWATSLTINATLGGPAGEPATEPLVDRGTIEWLLGCQNTAPHPFTGADPGGWGWSDRSGSVPDADDTPAALLALAKWMRLEKDEAFRRRIAVAAAGGLRWLLDLQNRDGGWPTFCRGWGALPFDRSGSDLTAHAARAITAWRRLHADAFVPWDRSDRDAARFLRGAPSALRRGRRYLARQQRPDGSWLPLWFGNQDDPDETNPVYGTARVLVAYRECGWAEDTAATKGVEYLLKNQNADGGWGGGLSVRYAAAGPGAASTVEETAQAVEALAAFLPAGHAATLRAIDWLCSAVERGWHLEPQPIGFYFAKLWYYERVYPLVYTLAALRAVR